MNVYIQNKTAKQAGVLKEIDRPLDPRIDKLFRWDVALTDKYGGLFEEIDIMIIMNALTGYSVFVPFVKTVDKDIYDLIEKYIHLGIDLLGLDSAVIADYFKKAGKFEFGLINGDPLLTSKLREKTVETFASVADRERENFNDQKTFSEFLTNWYNKRDYYRKSSISIAEYMR